MSTTPWKPGIATAIGSMPGTDPVEAARVIVGELPDVPHVPELPARGIGADSIGRATGMLVSLAAEVVPSGYRVTSNPGRDNRRAVDLLRHDVDALQVAVETASTSPTAVKTQVAGPWTLAANVELARGHRVLTDSGALRDFTESLAEGVTAHIEEVAARTDAPVVVQLDEPSLPDVLAGALPTPSGYGTVPAVPEPEVRTLLAGVIERLREASGHPVVVHCCGDRPPLGMLRRAGAGALAVDAATLTGANAELFDELGEVWEEGATLLLGLVPGSAPAAGLTARAAAEPAFDLVRRLGFVPRTLAEHAVPVPACGLSGATPDWARRALTTSRELAEVFLETD